MSDAVPGAANTTDGAGTQLGRYQILRRLAIGGMAEIFLARATGAEDFQKLVVCKRILPQFAADVAFRRMFLDEAKLSARLHHPHIVQVFDLGQQDEQYFFVLEYVPGRSLQEVLQRARDRSVAIEIEVGLCVALGLCAGLHHAHEQRDEHGQPLGIVHRDVSPSNVLVARDGTVKIVDFGIAKAASSSTVTRDAFVKGKVGYMAPEQCTSGNVDRRSDVFAIAVVLYELTTGTRLFTGDSDWAVMHQIADHDAPPPSQRRPDYPPALEAILLRALSRDPQDRHATALELQLDLENFAREARLSPSPVEVARLMTTLFAEELARDEQDARALSAPLPAAKPRRPRALPIAAGLLAGLAALWTVAGRVAIATRTRAADYDSFHDAVVSARLWTVVAVATGSLAVGVAIAGLRLRRRKALQ